MEKKILQLVDSSQLPNPESVEQAIADTYAKFDKDEKLMKVKNREERGREGWRRARRRKGGREVGRRKWEGERMERKRRKKGKGRGRGNRREGRERVLYLFSSFRFGGV